MESKVTAQDKFNQLRQQAEILLRDTSRAKGLFDVDDPLRLIHELQTVHIELELQYEELHRSQQELMQSKIDYTELYDHSPVGYLTLNRKGLILKANLTFADMLSMGRSLVINHPVSDFIHFNDQDIYYRHLHDLADSKTRQICELRMKRTDGTLLWVDMESTIIFEGAEEPGQFRTVVIDISDRKTAEKEKEKLEISLRQAQKMEAIGTFAGGIAHDFNNILSPIIGFAELSLDLLPENHPVGKNLQQILQGGERARDLVKQIILFSRQKKNQLAPVMVSPLIREVLKLLRPIISSNIEIREELDNNYDFILGDITQIHEIILNLCTNACQEMQKTGGILTIGLTRADPDQNEKLPGKYCCLSISDTGTGIPPEIINNIFDPYFTTKAVGEGSGLGLSVTKGIVKSHGGRITVESKPGKGSVFKVYFPITSPKETSKQKRVDRPNPAGNERILFVDDEETIVKLGVQLLERVGYRVTGKTSSTDALGLFETMPDKFDLVITDMAMPEIVGTRFAKKLLEIRADIPIILCTGFSEGIDHEIASSAGICDVLHKPVLSKNLYSSIRKNLDRARKKQTEPRDTRTIIRSS